MSVKSRGNTVFSKDLGRLLADLAGFGAIFAGFYRPAEPLNRHFIRLAGYVGYILKAGTPF